METSSGGLLDVNVFGFIRSVGEAQPPLNRRLQQLARRGRRTRRLGRRVNGRQITITEMNTGTGATVANGYHTTGFHVFDTRTVEDVPGIGYILIP